MEGGGSGGTSGWGERARQAIAGGVGLGGASHRAAFSWCSINVFLLPLAHHIYLEEKIISLLL